MQVNSISAYSNHQNNSKLQARFINFSSITQPPDQFVGQIMRLAEEVLTKEQIGFLRRWGLPKLNARKIFVKKIDGSMCLFNGKGEEIARTYILDTANGRIDLKRNGRVHRRLDIKDNRLYSVKNYKRGQLLNYRYYNKQGKVTSRYPKN